MGAFDGLIVAGVDLANQMTGAIGGLQVTVTHKVWQSETLKGVATYTTTTRTGAWTQEEQLITDSSGKVVLARHYVLFADNVPVDVKDQIIFPGGKTGPILKISAPINPTGNVPFITEVWLG